MHIKAVYRDLKGSRYAEIDHTFANIRFFDDAPTVAALERRFFHLLLVNLGGHLAAACKHAGCAFQQRPRQGVDHRRMKPEPARQFGHRLFALQRLILGLLRVTRK